MYNHYMKNVNKVPHYTVIFDTNILLRHFPAVEELILKYKDDKRVKINYLIPELVEYEYQFHFHRLVKKASDDYNAGLEDLKKLLGKRGKNIENIKDHSYKKAKARLNKLKIKSFPIPYDEIDFKKVIKKAAFHEEPFQPEGDKGFKDLIISETILFNLNEFQKRGEVVFICNDERLRDYASSKNLKVYQSPPDFETELRLHLLDLNDQLIDEIKKKAEKEFLSLYAKEDIKSRIHNSFSNLFNNPKPIPVQTYLSTTMPGLSNFLSKTKWAPLEEPTYEITKPTFITKRDDVYIWETSVVYRQVFQEEPMRVNFAYASGYYRKEGVYTLEFSVQWSTKLNPQGEIEASEVLSINYNKAPDISYYQTFTSGASLAGQGTIPIGYSSGTKIQITINDY